jgi:ribosome maturation factor RimP
MTARTPRSQQLTELLGPVITSRGYDLEDLSVTSAGRRSLIRVIVDGDDGIDLDAVADVSRAVSEVLDGAEDGGGAFAGPYVLEVSSPGTDRPLSEPRHWRRAVGRLVTVEADGRPVTARVLSADDHEVTLQVDGTEHAYPFNALGRGKIQIEFSRPGQSEVLDDLSEEDEDDLSEEDEDALSEEDEEA